MNTAKTPKSQSDNTERVEKLLSTVLGNSHTLHSSLYMLHIMREKIHSRKYQPFDNREITAELQRLNHSVQKLYGSMEALNYLLREIAD